MQEAGGINLYAYVNGDPLGYVDPDGRFVFAIPALVGVGQVIVDAAAISLAAGMIAEELSEDPDDITRGLIDGLEADPHDYPKNGSGGQSECDRDFDRYPGDEHETGDPKRRRKTLPDGRVINTHPSGKRAGNPPTLDVPKPGSKNPKRNRVKIRYE